MLHFDWSLYKGNLNWLQKNTIYLTRYGSVAYNTNTPTSDLDIRGIAIAPKEYYIGLTNNFEQAESKNVELDLVIFELRKFMHLASNCNPNALELLFTDESDHYLDNPLGRKLLDNRDLFLSRRVKFTFQGYAHSQMKRILTHRRWLLNPLTHKPTREEFGLPDKTLIPKNQLDAANSAIKKRCDEWNWHELESVDQAARLEIQDEFNKRLLDIMCWSYTELEDKVWRAATNSLGFNSNFIELLDKERTYVNKLKDWQHYQEWKENRNPERAKMEAAFGFDCYSEDTEFLTDKGWKLFDSITDDCLLATVCIKENMVSRRFLGIEYQKPIDKFDSLYSGAMYNITGTHLDSLVTPNHRMLFRKSERKSHKKYKWVLEEAAMLPDTFDILFAPIPRKTTFSNKELFVGLPIPIHAYLSLMGWYLSDGCAMFDTDGDMSLKSITISQKPDGKLSGYMKKWNNKYCKIANSSIHTYIRKPNEFNPIEHQEMILSIRNCDIINNIINDCNYKENKRIPRYIFGLSKSLLECLLFALIRGDGTKREHKTKDNSYIYYSKSKNLADDVQELALIAGWETSMWGPYLSGNDKYEHLMYQVHLRQTETQTRTLVRCKNVEKINVENKRIVCFTVPNGTLITRRNGKIAIHGNSKHAMHLVRLSRSCKELLSEGVLRVRRPDAAELLSIRNGAWTFDQLIDWFEAQSKEIDALYVTSKLRNVPNINKINKLAVELIESSWL